MTTSLRICFKNKEKKRDEIMKDGETNKQQKERQEIEEKVGGNYHFLVSSNAL